MIDMRRRPVQRRVVGYGRGYHWITLRRLSDAVRVAYEANFSVTSLKIRALFTAVLTALGVIIADSRTGTFSQIRERYMDTAKSVAPIYFKRPS